MPERGEDDDHLPVTRLDDAGEDGADEAEDDGAPDAAQAVRDTLAADFLGASTRGPRSYAEWLGRVDWPRTFPAVVDAERALAELSERWHASSETEAFSEIMQLEEAVAQARIMGWVTTRYRVRERLLLVDEEAEKHLEWYRPFLRITAGDSYAIKALVRIRRFYDPPWRLAVNEVLAAGFHTGGIDPADPWGGLDDADEMEEERLAERLREWLNELRSEVSAQSPVVRTAAAIWRLRAQCGGLIGEPASFERFLAPALLVRRDARMAPPFLSRAFMDRTSSWRPSDAPDVWLRRFAEGVARAARMAKGDLSLLERRTAVAMEMTADRRTNSRLGVCAGMIARREMTTAAAIRRHFGWRITDRAVRQMLEMLEQRGLVQEITGRKRFKIYAHPSIGRYDLFLEPQSASAAPGRQPDTRPEPAPAATPRRQESEVDLSEVMRDAERATRRIEELRQRGLSWLSGDRGEAEESPSGARETDG